MIVDRIGEYLKGEGKTLDEALRYEVEKLSGWTFKRQFMTPDEGVKKGILRLSSSGRCARQTAYSFHGFEKNGKEADPRARIVFWMGDLVEVTVVSLAKLAGVSVTGTGLNQLEIKLPVNGGFVTGHPDGVVFENKEQFLLEVKSMSSYGFEKFEAGEVDASYLAQINCYMECLGLQKCIMVAINKESGVMHELILQKDQGVLDAARKNLATVMHSTPENLPDRAHGPDVKGLLPWNCSYCSYYGTCWGNSIEKVLIRNSWKLKVIGGNDGQDKSGNRTRAPRAAA